MAGVARGRYRFRVGDIPALLAVGSLLVSLGGILYKLADISHDIDVSLVRWAEHDAEELRQSQEVARLSARMEGVSAQATRCEERLDKGLEVRSGICNR